MSVTEAELHVLCRIAAMAAKEVMAVYGSEIAVSSKRDSSPVTYADLRSDAVIRQQLTKTFPGVFILSEESSSDHPSESDVFFLVDPLDGTKEFIQRNREFTVNIALVQAGEPVAGVVLAPASGELFFAGRGLGSWQQAPGGATRLRVASRAPGEPLRVIGSRSHGGPALSAWLARLKCDYRFVAAGSSLKFCRLAQGQADIYPRLGPTCQWDTAAGQAVLQEAGGCVLGPDGQPLTYGLLRPVLNPNFVAVANPDVPYPPVN